MQTLPRIHFFHPIFRSLWKKSQLKLTATETGSHNRKTEKWIKTIFIWRMTLSMYAIRKKIEQLITSWCAHFIRAKHVSCQNRFQFVRTSKCHTFDRFGNCFKRLVASTTPKVVHIGSNQTFLPSSLTSKCILIGRIYFVITYIELGPILPSLEWRKSIPNLFGVWVEVWIQTIPKYNECEQYTRIARNTEIA